jgi:hypothetical protein
VVRQRSALGIAGWRQAEIRESAGLKRYGLRVTRQFTTLGICPGLLLLATSMGGFFRREKCYPMPPISTFWTYPTWLTMSSVDGSRVARGKLTQWHWSGAVFCPAC